MRRRTVRRTQRRLHAAGFPRSKRLDDFDFAANPALNPALIGQLATSDWVRQGRPLCLIGDSGTGKTHLLIALGTAAAERGHTVRYVLAAKLVNELAEAADERHLARTIARYGRADLILIDELGYLQLDRRGAELLFQVLTEREERSAVAIASNEPFSGWTKTFTDPRLCAAIVDRLTYNGHTVTIEETIVEVSKRSSPSGERMIVKPYPKDNEPRTFGVRPGWLDDVADHIRERGLGRDELLFSTETGTPISRNTFRTRVWLPAVQASGVDFGVRVHDLRHAHASWLLAGGADLKGVMERMGHAQIQTTQKYLHTLPETDQKNLDALSRIAGPGRLARQTRIS